MPEVSSPTPAQQSVWSVVATIPKGRVMTYAEVADRAGLGRAARMVSSALRKAPAEMALPWYRVINSQGKISFPENSTAYKNQYCLLLNEGVVFIKGKINLSEFMPASSMDKQLWSGLFEK